MDNLVICLLPSNYYILLFNGKPVEGGRFETFEAAEMVARLSIVYTRLNNFRLLPNGKRVPLNFDTDGMNSENKGCYLCFQHDCLGLESECERLGNEGKCSAHKVMMDRREVDALVS